MAADYVGWGIGIAGIVAATGVAIWAGLRQGPKSDVRIDGIALMYLSLNDGDNTFKVKITNHGNAVGEITRTEVQATLDGSALTAKIGGRDAAGTIATSESKELWLDVVLPEPTGMDVHDGRKRLRVTVTLHPTKGKAIRASFDFSRNPGYGFVPSVMP